MMRILLFTTLYPNKAAPSHGLFVENRLRAYLQKYEADVKVIAPTPWFPFKSERFGAYGRYAKAPASETRHNIEIRHPRYFIAPKISMNTAPEALSRCFEQEFMNLAETGWKPDLIDAHYLYPDAIAAEKVAARHQLPMVATARGTDVSLITEFDKPRARIVNLCIQADEIITVAAALKDRLVELGAPHEKISVLRNGVDLDAFRQLDREAIRAEMGLAGRVIASVGHLIERKGHHLVIDALAQLDNATLLIVGDGSERGFLEKRARDLKVADRTRFLGSLPHNELCRIYNAADVLALASSREGWPNVLLEAMACGTPCAATPIWGNGEVIRAPEAGRLTNDRSAEAIADTIKDVLNDSPARDATRQYAEAHSWEETADRMHQVFTGLHQKKQRRDAVKARPFVSSNDEWKPRLIVTVDTEERFDWATFDRDGFTLAPIEDVARFQETCSQLGVVPHYFLSYPLLVDQQSRRFFREIFATGQAAAGLHLHPWVTPPETDLRGEYFSYQKNYNDADHSNKLRELAKAFEENFGQKAQSHRAGRYGVARENYHLLAEAGLVYDFSPSTAFSFSQTGGPDFTGYSNKPFVAETPRGDVFVTPVCGARAIRHSNFFLGQENLPPGFSGPRRVSRFTEPVRLTPEGMELSTLKALTKRLLRDRTPVLTFTLHSTSLTVGATDYSATAESVNAILAKTRAYMDWFRTGLGGEVVSFDGLKDFYSRHA